MSHHFHVVAIGHALVDFLAFHEDAFLEAHHMVKGSMALIDEERANALFSTLNISRTVAGGSAANTAVGLASFGGKAAFIGKVKNDAIGAQFAQNMTQEGVHFVTPKSESGPATGQCYAIVNPEDSERTMSTYLGIASTLQRDDLDETLIASGDILYMEGYLWDGAGTSETLKAAIAIAHRHGKKVAFSLSDSFCVNRHAETWRSAEFLNNIDILFDNEAEAMALYETTTIEATIAAAKTRPGLTIITRSEQGSIACQEGEIYAIDSIKPARLLDSTGAGDLYASGFLYGITHGYTILESMALASKAASEILSVLGAKAEKPLAALLELPNSNSN
jgi:sugar/nucleoside kinase (ribokinase family)